MRAEAPLYRWAWLLLAACLFTTLRADAAQVLNRKRAAFLVTATERYGMARADARDALRDYGETLDLRRRSIRPDGIQVRVQVQRVRLIYEGGRLLPRGPAALQEAMDEARSEVRGVEVSVQ